MKIFVMAGLLLFVVSPYKCADENEETTEKETVGGSYDAQDAEVRSAIADWEQFLVQSDSIVDAACIKISQATDKLENGQVHHKGRHKSAIIKAQAKMEKLSDMLMAAKKIRPENYKFDENELQHIEHFKKEFKSKREELNEALEELEAK